MQVKLLRVLQERSFERVGSNRTMRCNVRIIAATHRDLDAAIVAGRFREDLYYRLNVFPIQMPPLRERLEDLPVLIEHLVQRQGQIAGRHIRLDKEAMNCLARNRWPGNVRELANLLERLAILFPEQTVTAADLPERYRSMGTTAWFGSGVRIVPPAPDAQRPPGVSPALLEELLEVRDSELEEAVQLTDTAGTCGHRGIRRYGGIRGYGDIRRHEATCGHGATRGAGAIAVAPRRHGFEGSSVGD